MVVGSWWGANLILPSEQAPILGASTLNKTINRVLMMFF